MDFTLALRKSGPYWLVNPDDTRQARPAVCVLSGLCLAPGPAEWLKRDCGVNLQGEIWPLVFDSRRSLVADPPARNRQDPRLTWIVIDKRKAEVSLVLTYHTMMSSELPSGPGGKNQKKSCSIENASVTDVR